jgi:hypothetical protein
MRFRSALALSLSAASLLVPAISLAERASARLQVSATIVASCSATTLDLNGSFAGSAGRLPSGTNADGTPFRRLPLLPDAAPPARVDCGIALPYAMSLSREPATLTNGENHSTPVREDPWRPNEGTLRVSIDF